MGRVGGPAVWLSKSGESLHFPLAWTGSMETKMCLCLPKTVRLHSAQHVLSAWGIRICILVGMLHARRHVVYSTN